MSGKRRKKTKGHNKSKSSEGSRKEKRAQRRAARAELREKQRQQGLLPRDRITLTSGTSQYESEEEEREQREAVLVAQMRVFRSQLPLLLNRFRKIPDPRNPKKLKHQLTSVLLMGLLLCVYQMSSRREANREMSRPTFVAHLKVLIPELESYPHQDTVDRVLSLIDVDNIEQAHVAMIRSLIRKKKFARYLVEHCYCVAFDGSQKLSSYDPKSEQWQHRLVGKEEEAREQYYVYVLQATLCFRNGMNIPLMTEFLEVPDGDVAVSKQDCELKAFYRLAERLKKNFPRLPIMVLLDGLYANGPVMARCREYDWQFMIVLQDKSLPLVWEEYEAIVRLEGEKNRCQKKFYQRRQTFTWANRIDYAYGPNGRHRQKVHVVVCEERWEEIDPETSKPVEMTSRWAWLSSYPLTRENVHPRCNLAARARWGIETGFLVEKHQGYNFEHCFSFNWNSMRGYHYLMRLGECLNVLTFFTTALADAVKELGKRPLIKFIRETLSGPWLERETLPAKVNAPFQLRLQ